MERDDRANRPQCGADPAPDGAFNQHGAERRAFVRAALIAGVAGLLPRAAGAATPIRAQEGDRFVFFSGERAGAEIKPEDLVAGAHQVIAWPLDPATRAPRDASRLNQVILIRLDPEGLDEPTRGRSAEGIVAYSAVCTHAQCPIAGWNADKKVFHCNCHNSEYDPRLGGKVVFGPAPRPLPALPLRIEHGALVASGTFTGRVGAQPG